MRLHRIVCLCVVGLCGPTRMCRAQPEDYKVVVKRNEIHLNRARTITLLHLTYLILKKIKFQHWTKYAMPVVIVCVMLSVFLCIVMWQWELRNIWSPVSYMCTKKSQKSWLWFKNVIKESSYLPIMWVQQG